MSANEKTLQIDIQWKLKLLVLDINRKVYCSSILSADCANNIFFINNI